MHVMQIQLQNKYYRLELQIKGLNFLKPGPHLQLFKHVPLKHKRKVLEKPCINKSPGHNLKPIQQTFLPANILDIPIANVLILRRLLVLHLP
jgi:hypothetical protein